MVAPDVVPPKDPLDWLIPPSVRVLADEVKLPRLATTPLLIDRFAATVVAIPNVFVPLLENIKLLKVVTDVPPIVCVVPLKLIVLPVFVKVVPLFIQSTAILCVKDPAVKAVPDPKVTVPPIVKPVTPVVAAVPPSVKLPLIAVVPACKVLTPLPEKPRFA